MASDSPSINSTRILRAYRLNNVENAKLNNQLFVLDKSKRREMRLANQDIRLINLTLEYINSSSGHSPEGLHPDYVDKTKREESAPMFMYGERLVSRKFGKKFRRVQSAHVGMNRRDSEEDLTNQGQDEATADQNIEKNNNKTRPKSSPAKPLTFTGLRRTSSLRHKGEKSEGRKQGSVGGGVQRSASMKHHQTEEAVSEAEQEPLTAVAIETVREREDSILNDATRDSQLAPSSQNRSVSNELSNEELSVENKVKLSDIRPIQNEEQSKESKKVPPIYLTDRGDVDNSVDQGMNDSVYTPIIRRPKSRLKSKNQGRTQEMTKKVKEAREQVLNARKSKPDPMQAWALPASNPLKQQAVMDVKKNMNVNKNQVIQDRLKEFMQLYPVRKY